MKNLSELYFSLKLFKMWHKKHPDTKTSFTTFSTTYTAFGNLYFKKNRSEEVFPTALFHNESMALHIIVCIEGKHPDITTHLSASPHLCHLFFSSTGAHTHHHRFGLAKWLPLHWPSSSSHIICWAVLNFRQHGKWNTLSSTANTPPKQKLESAMPPLN